MIVVGLFFAFSVWDIEPLSSSSLQISRVQSSSWHNKDNRSIIPSVLCYLVPQNLHTNLANSYSTPRKCPFICKILYWVGSWGGAHSIPCPSLHSGYQPFQNLDSFIPRKASLEEPCCKVFLLQFIDDVLQWANIFLCLLRSTGMF